MTKVYYREYYGKFLIIVDGHSCFNEKGKDIVVKLKGGDLIVNYTDEQITLEGTTDLIFTGVIEY